MAKGGARPGAGRKPGASFAQLVSLAEKKKFVEFVLDQYMGDIRLALWMGDQLFGKAPQSIDHTTDGEKIQIIAPQAVIDTFNLNEPTPQAGGGDTK